MTADLRELRQRTPLASNPLAHHRGARRGQLQRHRATELGIATMARRSRSGRSVETTRRAGSTSGVPAARWRSCTSTGTPPPGPRDRTTPRSTPGSRCSTPSPRTCVAQVRRSPNPGCPSAGSTPPAGSPLSIRPGISRPCGDPTVPFVSTTSIACRGSIRRRRRVRRRSRTAAIYPATTRRSGRAGALFERPCREVRLDRASRASARRVIGDARAATRDHDAGRRPSGTSGDDGAGSTVASTRSSAATRSGPNTAPRVSRATR